LVVINPPVCTEDVEVFHAEDFVFFVAADDVHVTVLEIDHSSRDEEYFIRFVVYLVYVDVRF